MLYTMQSQQKLLKKVAVASAAVASLLVSVEARCFVQKDAPLEPQTAKPVKLFKGTPDGKVPEVVPSGNVKYTMKTDLLKAMKQQCNCTTGIVDGPVVYQGWSSEKKAASPDKNSWKAEHFSADNAVLRTQKEQPALVNFTGNVCGICNGHRTLFGADGTTEIARIDQICFPSSAGECCPCIFQDLTLRGPGKDGAAMATYKAPRPWECEHSCQQACGAFHILMTMADGTQLLSIRGPHECGQCCKGDCTIYQNVHLVVDGKKPWEGPVVAKGSKKFSCCTAMGADDYEMEIVEGVDPTAVVTLMMAANKKEEDKQEGGGGQGGGGDGGAPAGQIMDRDADAKIHPEA